MKTCGSFSAYSCSISPPLPSGILFDPKNCAISGKISAPTTLAAYTVTASNSSGNSSAVLSIQGDYATIVSMPYGILKTGQTISYAEGDDGYWQKGVERTFVPGKKEGLVWQKCADGLDPKTCAGTANTYNYYNGNNYSNNPRNICDNIDTDNRKWRLPSIFELVNLIENAQINYSIFPNMPLKIGSKHFKYNSNYYDSSLVRYLDTNFSGLHYWTTLNGYSYSTFIIDKVSIQCISGNELLETRTMKGKMVNRKYYFRKYDNTETIVQNLIFEKCDALSTDENCSNTTYSIYTWIEALTYCNTLTLDNRKWRLPNKNELFNFLSIYSSSFTVGDNSIAGDLYIKSIPNFNTNYVYWTSTTNPSDTSSAYTINMQNGGIGSSLKTQKRYLRCVTDD